MLNGSMLEATKVCKLCMKSTASTAFEPRSPPNGVSQFIWRLSCFLFRPYRVKCSCLQKGVWLLLLHGLHGVGRGQAYAVYFMPS